MKMKYIKYDMGLTDTIVVFSDVYSHDEFAYKLGVGFNDVISAGFVRPTEDSVECYGESVSLGVKSDPIDTGILKRQFGLTG